MNGDEETLAIYLEAYRKLQAGAISPEPEGTVSLTFMECAVLVDRLYCLRERLEKLANTAKERMVLTPVRPEIPREAQLWTEKVDAFGTAVEDAEEALGRRV